MLNHRRIALFCVLALLSCHARAQDDGSGSPELVEAITNAPGDRAVWSLYWENDGAFIKPNGNTDRHYTNGARIVASAHAQWADELANWLPFNPADGEAYEPLRTAAFYSIGHQIFTPDRIENFANAHPGDRPYAGWLYFSAGFERASATVADRVDLKLGVIGPASRAEQVQQNIHDAFDEDREPQGWETQLNDRFAIDLDVNRRWKIALDHNDDDHLAIELIPEAGFTIGSVHDHLMAGATLRIGSPFLPGDFGAGRLEAPSTAALFPTGNVGTNEELAWSIYTRVEGRRVFHNEFLEGVEAEEFLGMVQVGVTLQIMKNLTLGYSQTWFTKEFETQVGRDSFAAVTVAWSWVY